MHGYTEKYWENKLSLKHTHVCWKPKGKELSVLEMKAKT